MNRINMNEFVEKFEDVIYRRKTVKIQSLEIFVKKYIPIEEKYGIANRLFSMLYNDNIYDYVNARFLVPVFLLEVYSDDVEFPKNIEDLDATGIYDMLKVSGALDEIYQEIGDEWDEVNEILLSLVKMADRERDFKNPMEDFLGDISSKTPEDIDKMTKQVKELMQDENIQKMIQFKKKADK